MLRKSITKLFQRYSTKKVRIPKKLFSKTSKSDSRKWNKEFSKDPFVKKARSLDYRSRASFKLLEIETRYKLISKAKKILELGCFPGGWAQILQEHASKGSKILGVDLLATQKIPEKKGVNLKMIEGDIFKSKTLAKISEYFNGEPVNLVVCDVSPHFMGDLDTDHQSIVEMNLQVLNVSEKILATGGNLIIKTLNGTDEKKIFDLFQVNFKDVKRMKPSASRAKSAELYYIGLGYKLTDFWRKVGELKPEEKNMETIMELLPESVRLTPEEFKRAKTMMKYQIAHNEENKNEISNPLKNEFISKLTKEMKDENFIANNKKKPVYSMNDLADMYDKHCEESNYKYSYTKKLPRKFSGVVEEYEKAKPKLMLEIQELIEMNCKLIILFN